MDTNQALIKMKGLKEEYEVYSAVFGIAIAQLEATLQVQLTELEQKKVENEDLKKLLKDNGIEVVKAEEAVIEPKI